MTLMHIRSLVAGIAFSTTLNLAYALDIRPYSETEFSQLRKTGQIVALHFHAPWCVVCEAQSRMFEDWKDDPDVPGVLLVVDYDKEKSLRQKMRVRMQSTVIVFKGRKEKSRVVGDSRPDSLMAALAEAR